MQKIKTVVKIVFDKYDKDQSGSLQNGEIRDMLKDLHRMGHIDVMPSDQEMRDFIMMTDRNGNGRIEKNELIALLKKLIF